MNTTIKTLILALSLAATVGAASAETRFQALHPRRAEVNERLVRQDHRINVERREGVITRREAVVLHRRDHVVRHQERVFASRHNGHISRFEQHRLNHEENGVGRRIG